MLVGANLLTFVAQSGKQKLAKRFNRWSRLSCCRILWTVYRLLGASQQSDNLADN